MKTIAHCKFCKTQLMLEIDEGYAGMGDPFNLVKLAACNRCADLKVRQRKLTAALANCCVAIIRWTPAVKDDIRRLMRQTLEQLTREYARMVAQWHHMEGMLWEEQFIDLLMENPGKLGIILGSYWKQFRAHRALPA